MLVPRALQTKERSHYVVEGPYEGCWPQGSCSSRQLCYSSQGEIRGGSSSEEDTDICKAIRMGFSEEPSSKVLRLRSGHYRPKGWQPRSKSSMKQFQLKMTINTQLCTWFNTFCKQSIQYSIAGFTSTSQTESHRQGPVTADNFVDLPAVQMLGMIVNHNKSVLETNQTLEFLGFEI